MTWVGGVLRKQEGSARLQVVAGSDWIEIPAGAAMAFWVDGRWLEGRVEYSGLTGWHWTNGRLVRKILSGDHVRVHSSVDPRRRSGVPPLRPKGGGRHCG